jgi:hypothetical protein
MKSTTGVNCNTKDIIHRVEIPGGDSYHSMMDLNRIIWESLSWDRNMSLKGKVGKKLGICRETRNAEEEVVQQGKEKGFLSEQAIDTLGATFLTFG